MLIFSVWDAKRNGAVTSRVMPMPTPSEEARGETDLQCKRNCNDCAVHGHFTTDGTGVKCFYNLPRNIEEGDELTLKIEREPVQSTTGGFRGHVWRVSLEYTGGPNGNFIRGEMYKQAPACSACPAGTSCSKQFPGLCCELLRFLKMVEVDIFFLQF